jgi:hypothetical protein
MRVEAVRSEEPELAWSMDDEGLKFRSGPASSESSVEVKRKQDKKKNDDDDGPGSSGLSITAKLLPFFSLSGSPALA